MSIPSSFKNRSGVEYTLKAQVTPTSTEASYHRFEVRATLPDGPGHTFVVVIKKTFLPDPNDALKFLSTDPWNDIKARLNKADQKGVDIFLPEFGADWGVV